MLIRKGGDYSPAVKRFSYSQNTAGVAFANAGTGAVHAMSYPLSGKYHVTHGLANYLFFTAVFKEYQLQKPIGDIQNINGIPAEILNCDKETVYSSLEDLLDKIISR